MSELTPSTGEPQNTPPAPPVKAQAQSADYTLELQSYIEIGSTSARNIRWLTFAIAICVGATALVLVSHHFGIQQFALARAVEIKKTCFGQERSTHNVQDCTAAKESCDKFVCETGDGNYADAADRNLQNIKEQERIINDTRLVLIPLVNIKIVTPDFAIVLIALSLFFLFWLRLTLEFIRNTLCNLYNDVNLPSHQATRTLPAHFLLLWPGGARRKSHRVIWFILWSLASTIFLIIVSDVIEVFFFRFPGARYALWSLPGWEQFSPYAYGKIVLELALGGIVTVLMLRIRTVIRDVRNLLMLIEWGARAFEPVLYRLFKHIDDPLKTRENEILYKESDDGYLLSLRLTFLNDAALPGGDKMREVIFSAPVDLWQHMAEENKDEKPHRAPSWMFGSSERKGHTTLEDEKMRMFFFNVLTGAGGDKIFSETFFKEVVWPRKLRALIRRFRKVCDPELMREMGISKDSVEMQIEKGRGADVYFD